MYIFGGIVFVGVGALIVIYTEWLLKNFGRISWFEKHLGAEGGSRLGYKIIGMLIIFVGFLMLTGMFTTSMEVATSPLTKGRL